MSEPMNTSELEARPYAPCPTCGQYSHSIGEDQIVAAYNHFQAMVCENPAKPYPTGYAFSDETRDAANVLLQSLSTLRQRIEALEAVLPTCREIIARELRILLESCCLLDKNLEPIRETFDGGPSDDLIQMEETVAAIDALIARQALGEGKP